MKCPKCGNELRISKKDPNFALCDICRKKYRIPNQNRKPAKDYEEEEHYPKYANIPPKSVREKRENEMRKAYDELLAIGREEREGKRGLFGRRKKSR